MFLSSLLLNAFILCFFLTFYTLAAPDYSGSRNGATWTMDVKPMARGAKVALELTFCDP